MDRGNDVGSRIATVGYRIPVSGNEVRVFCWNDCPAAYGSVGSANDRSNDAIRIVSPAQDMETRIVERIEEWLSTAPCRTVAHDQVRCVDFYFFERGRTRIGDDFVSFAPVEVFECRSAFDDRIEYLVDNEYPRRFSGSGIERVEFDQGFGCFWIDEIHESFARAAEYRAIAYENGKSKRRVREIESGKAEGIVQFLNRLVLAPESIPAVSTTEYRPHGFTSNERRTVFVLGRAGRSIGGIYSVWGVSEWALRKSGELVFASRSADEVRISGSCARIFYVGRVPDRAEHALCRVPLRGNGIARIGAIK